jgi:1,4-dihydroxy-2-naphthoate octaprenyltransferase
VYVWLIGWVIAGAVFDVDPHMPVWSLLGLLTLPLAARAIKSSFHSENPARFVPGMAANVMVVLSTQLLIGIGYILARAV